MQFGDDFALPLLGNFDPPIDTTVDEGPDLSGTFTGSLTNEHNPLDTNVDGVVTARDALVVINALGRIDPALAVDPGRLVAALGGYKLDASQDGKITSLDALRVINGLAKASANSESAQSEQASWAVAADNVISAMDDDDDDDLLALLAADQEYQRVK